MLFQAYKPKALSRRGRSAIICGHGIVHVRVKHKEDHCSSVET